MGLALVVFYNKLSWFVSKLPEKYLKCASVVRVVFYNKLLRFLYKLRKNDFSDVGGLV